MQTAQVEFVVVWDNGHTAIKSGQEISHMLDLADCDMCDGVAGIYSVNEQNELVKISVGKMERDSDYDPEGSSLVFAYAPIMAGTRRVGTLAYTDH